MASMTLVAALGCSAADGGEDGYGSSAGGDAGQGGQSGQAGAASTAGTGGTASGGAGTAGSAAGGADTLPDPGPPPAAAVGAFLASKMAGNGKPPKLTTSAIFTNPATNLGTTGAQAMLSHYENVPLDSCKNINAGPQTVSSDNPNLLDVGAIAVLAPDGQTHGVPKQQFAGYVFYEGELPLSAFVPLGEYRLLGDGWDGAFWAPGELEVTSPSLAGGVVSVPRSQPLAVRWQGTPDGHPVLIFLEQGDTIITCRAVDDGSFDIPTSALTAFEISGGAFDPAPNEDHVITVQRLTWYPVGVKNGVAAAVVQFEVGARIEVSFE